jgi:hypothetical protein
MKINGQEIPQLKYKEAVFMREPVPIVLKCNPITDLDAFDNLCPLPEPPEMIRPGGVREKNENSPAHQKALEEHTNKKMGWMVIESTKDNNITWETVDMDDIDTYSNYKSELIDSGFTPIEINYLLDVILKASQVETEDLKAMRESFLAERDQESEL